MWNKLKIILASVVFVMATLPVAELACAAPKSTVRNNAAKSVKAKKTSKAVAKTAKNTKTAKTAKNRQNIAKKSIINKKTANKKSVQASRASVKGKVTVKAKVPPRNSRKLASQSWQETQDLVVQSNSALVVDQRKGEVLYQKNGHVVMPIASITKLMTAMVVLDSSSKMSQTITVTDDDIDYLRGSRSRLPVGSMMTRDTALLLALMSSENRAANALSRHYPGGKRTFIAAMNAKAKSLGMSRTRFEDPTGLSSRNVSTARDLARMVSAAYNYPMIREFSTTPEAIVDVSGQERGYHNTNPLVKSASWDVGLSKTGFIHEAGKCLVMQARVARKPVVIVLLDANGRLTRVGDANRIKKWMESVQIKSADDEGVS